MFHLLMRRENIDCCRGYGEAVIIVFIEKHGLLADGVAPTVSRAALLRVAYGWFCHAARALRLTARCWSVNIFCFDWGFDCHVDYKFIRLWKYSPVYERCIHVTGGRQHAFMSLSPLLCDQVFTRQHSTCSQFNY